MSDIRPAAAADLEAVLALHRAFFAEDGYPFREEESRANLGTLLGDPSLGRLWVIDDGGAVMGYLVLAFGFSLEFGGRDAMIDEVYVAPSHRGQGLGKRALAVAVETCREMGIHALHLEVERYKEGAKGLYEKTGFVDHDRYLMTKWLETRSS